MKNHQEVRYFCRCKSLRRSSQVSDMPELSFAELAGGANMNFGSWIWRGSDTFRWHLVKLWYVVLLFGFWMILVLLQLNYKKCDFLGKFSWLFSVVFVARTLLRSCGSAGCQQLVLRRRDLQIAGISGFLGLNLDSLVQLTSKPCSYFSSRHVGQGKF